MDPTAQNTQTPPVQNTQQDQQQPVQTPQEPVTQQSVSVPAGGKEQEAMSIGGIQPSQPEVVVSQEVQEAGVEAIPAEEPQLTQEHKDAGLEAVKETAPVPQNPSKVQLPENYKVPKGFSLFHQKVKDAATWLWLLLFKVEQQKEHQK